jgi:DNA topoisomerase-1
MVFHEITKTAIDHAVNNPRGIDYGLVDAAETRRLLDRLYGYEVSPVLWRRVNRGLSAGRVQSPSVRLIVERERERIAFVSAGYWDIELLTGTAPAFTATLVALDGTKVATGKDFSSDGQPKKNVVWSQRSAPSIWPRRCAARLHRALGGICRTAAARRRRS